MQIWEPQPCATFVIDEYLNNSELQSTAKIFEPRVRDLRAIRDKKIQIFLQEAVDYAEYKRNLVGAAAFDCEYDLLCVLERLADEYKSVTHVWRISPEITP